MKPSISSLNKALRASRKAKGLVELRLWVSPQTRQDLSLIARENNCASPADAITLMVWMNRQAEKMKEEGTYIRA